MTWQEIKYQIKKDPKVIWYYIQGSILWFFVGKYIRRWYKRSYTCPECFDKGQCVVPDENGKICYCDFNKLSLTNKCKKI